MPATPIRYTTPDVELISNVICTNARNDAFIIKANVRVFSCDTGITELYICGGLNCAIERLTYFNDVTYATRASALLAAGYLLDDVPLPDDNGNTTTASTTPPSKSSSVENTNENNKSVSADVNGKPSDKTSIDITTPDGLTSGVDYEDASRRLVIDLIAPSKNGNAYEETVKLFLRRTLT